MFRFLSYFMGCNSNDDLVAETLKCCSGLFHFSGSTPAPVKSLLVLPEGVEGASLGLLMLLGGGGACWTWKTEQCRPWPFLWPRGAAGLCSLSLLVLLWREASLGPPSTTGWRTTAMTSKMLSAPRWKFGRHWAYWCHWYR